MPQVDRNQSNILVEDPNDNSQMPLIDNRSVSMNSSQLVGSSQFVGTQQLIGT